MAELPFHPLANLFPLIEGVAFAELVEDVRVNGVRESIVLHEGAILDGRNRWRAALATGIKPPCRSFDPAKEGDPLTFVLSKNLHRRHLTTSQRAMIGAEIASLRRGRPAGASPDNPPDGGISVREAAATLNVAERSIERARVIRDAGTPELAEAVKQGSLSVAAAADLARLPKQAQRDAILSADVDVLYRIVGEQRAAQHAARQQAKKEKRAEKERALGGRIAAGNAALLAAGEAGLRYPVILADPEWRFEPRSRETGMDRAADNHYPTSPTSEIRKRPVGAIAADDCVLFLWATAPMLPDAFAVLTDWGFTYCTNAIWVKRRSGEARGPGYWLTGEHEILIIATRGNPPCPAPGLQWPSVFIAPIGPHSAKPERAYELIESYFPSCPKIELNARARRPGWDVWGAEAPDLPEAEPGVPMGRPVAAELDAWAAGARFASGGVVGPSDPLLFGEIPSGGSFLPAGSPAVVGIDFSRRSDVCVEVVVRDGQVVDVRRERGPDGAPHLTRRRRGRPA